jgi:hypothetical protein
MTAIAMDNRFGIEMPVTQPLTLEWMKQVMGDHFRLLGDALKEGFIDMFGPILRATSNCSVDILGKAPKGYGLINWCVDHSKQLLGLDRNRGRSTGAGTKAPSVSVGVTPPRKAPGNKPVEITPKIR